jgi:hypothetical protein
VNPDEVVKLFPGWRVESKQESLWYLPKTQVETSAYSLISPNGTQLKAAYYHFHDKNTATRELNLLPNNKQYIIMVDRDEYDILHQN